MVDFEIHGGYWNHQSSLKNAVKNFFYRPKFCVEYIKWYQYTDKKLLDRSEF